MDKRISIFVQAMIHALGVASVTAVSIAPMVSANTFSLLSEASTHGFSLNFVKISLHVGIAACIWALIYIGYRLVQVRQRTRKLQVVRVARGSVMMEFLIVSTPFLLLVSGLGQLTALNITSILADLAAFQGARAAWVWNPEIDAGRTRTSYMQYRTLDAARAAASMALAPTAPNDYEVGREVPPGSSDYFRRQRAILTASFQRDGMRGEVAYEWSGGATALYGGGAFDLDVEEASDENLYYVNAFDVSGFEYRAARKMTFAEWGLWDNFEIVDTEDRIGVDFTYKYNLIFPWFGYIWGEENEVGMREGYYSPIRRRHTFPKQRSMQ